MRREGGGARREVRSRLTRWRVPWPWYAFALGWQAVHLLVSRAIAGLNPISAPDFEAFFLYALPLAFAVIFITAGLAEEVGWRGFALPRLQAVWSPLASSVVLGLVWACWHLPGDVLPGTAHYGKSPTEFRRYVSGTVAFTIILTWVFSSTGGSVFMTMPFHTASNTTEGFLPGEAMIGPVDVTVVITWLVALRVIFAGKMWRMPAPIGADHFQVSPLTRLR